MADDEDRLAWALAREPIDRAERAREDLIERLPTRPRNEAVVVPVRQTARLIECLSGPVTDINLAQLRHLFDRQPVAYRDHLRGIARAREVARNDPVELHLRELVG